VEGRYLACTSVQFWPVCPIQRFPCSSTVYDEPAKGGRPTSWISSGRFHREVSRRLRLAGQERVAETPGEVDSEYLSGPKEPPWRRAPLSWPGGPDEEDHAEQQRAPYAPRGQVPIPPLPLAAGVLGAVLGQPFGLRSSTAGCETTGQRVRILPSPALDAGAGAVTTSRTPHLVCRGSSTAAISFTRK